MGTMRERQREVELYRGQVPSPGRPTVAWREDRVKFWAAIAAGAKTEDAVTAAGVSSPVGFRWFRHAGGVNPCLPAVVSGRYLSFPEVRILVSTRESAVRARTQSANVVHALIVTAPEIVRERVRDLTPHKMLRVCANLRGHGSWPVDAQAAVTALRCAARRTLTLDEEAAELEKAIAAIVERAAPDLIAQRGVGPITAAVVFCAWSHPGRCRNEAAFAMLAGAAPIDASSGITNRHRLNRGGDRQLNRSLHTIVITRMRSDPDTIAYVERRTAQRHVPPRRSPLPQALRREEPVPDPRSRRHEHRIRA
jgi:hypothetical protein